MSVTINLLKKLNGPTFTKLYPPRTNIVLTYYCSVTGSSLNFTWLFHDYIMILPSYKSNF